MGLLNRKTAVPAVKSLTDILATFTQTIEDLERLKTSNTQKVSSNEETIRMLKETNHFLNSETNTATNVSSKLRELIS